MKAEEISALLIAQPFRPFRVHVSDGKVYDIAHPDQVIVTPHKILVGIGVQESTRIADHVEHCSLLHVTRLEEAAVTGNNGA